VGPYAKGIGAALEVLRRQMKILLPILLFLPLLVRAQDTLVVHFAYNRSELAPDEAVRLDSALRGSLSRIDLYGYTDSIGGNRYNDSLALARIHTVKSLLPDSLVHTTVGFGKKRPLNDNASEEERAANRRVEIVFWRIAGPAGGGAGRPAAPAGGGAGRPAGTADTIVELPPAASIDDLFKDPASMVGKTIILRDINFFGGHHKPEPESYHVLNDLLKLMSRNPGMQIDIQGFVCCLPDTIDALDLDTYIINLSEARAKFIYDYLKNRGIAGGRMRFEGYGASQKLYPAERTEEEKRLNRRVQIKVTAWYPKASQ